MDFEVMLKLGWAYNILKDDREAVRWFTSRATARTRPQHRRRRRAYGNLNPVSATPANHGVGVPHHFDALAGHLRLRAGQDRAAARRFPSIRT